jgi:hypothetical protein
MQTEGWAVILQDVQGTLEGLPSADQHSIIQIPDIQEEIRTLLLDALDEGLQDDAQKEGGNRVPLMNAEAAEESSFIEDLPWHQLPPQPRQKAWGIVPAPPSSTLLC